MGIQITYICDNPLRPTHYQLDEVNVIRVEQVVQGFVSRPMIFCSPECAAQYVDAWLQTRVHVDAKTSIGRAYVFNLDDDQPATGSGDVSGEEVAETEDSDTTAGVTVTMADETAETVDADTTASAGDVSASLDEYDPSP